MKLVRLLSHALAFFAVGASSLAAQHNQHKAYHPAGSATSAASKFMPGRTTPEMVRMANQTMAMQDMHDKMMAAKSPEERQGLMGEHMKAMQEGMGMMKGMGGMADSKNSSTNMTERRTWMEQRMDMIQAIMEMMVDRLPQTPVKP